MDEDSGHFAPMTEERHSPSSQADSFDQEVDKQFSQDPRVSPQPLDQYSMKESIEVMRTVIRRDGSPALSSERKRMMELVHGDNDELFTPAKTLNFTDADETETDVEDQRSLDQRVSFMQQNDLNTEEDLVSNGMRNQRVIEGHASSPMDHRVSVNVQSDQGQTSVHMSPGSSHLRKLSVESQDISPNLYDSLDEKEDPLYQYTSQHQTRNDVQSQNEADVSQSVFSPMESPNHLASRPKDSPKSLFQGTAFFSNRDLVHSSPQSEPVPSVYREKTSPQYHVMSQSLPETIKNQENYEEFRNNLGKKTEVTIPVSTSESEWYTPSVSTVNTGQTKPPVNHIALNIQRVKNASKANKNPAQSHQAGVCPRLNRVESKSNVSKIQPQARNNTSENPNSFGGKPSGQPRPVVQGSAGHDSQTNVTNQRQGQVNVKGHSNPEGSDHKQDMIVAPGGRYGGVGSEYKGNTGSDTDQFRSSPGSRVRSEQWMNVHQSRFEPHGLQSSQVKPTGYHGYNFGVSPPIHDRESVTTQVSQIRSPQHYRSSPNQDKLRQADLGQDLQGMEDVRSHLQSMLRLSNDVIKAESVKFDHSDTASELLMDQPLNRQLQFDTSSLLGSRAQEEVSELVENFPNLSSKIFSDISAMSVGRQEASVHAENQYLRDTMEKERYRRKHCEQHIQQLNTKLLETQQQLAVAVSTDKKKDIMIEQLDKQLAKVVEGWKKREREKDDYLKVLMKEKSQIEQTLNRQQAVVNNFEKEMADTLAELKREKVTSARLIEELKREVEVKTREKVRAEEVLEGEKERVNLVMQEWEQLKESRELAENRAQQLQDRLHKEQDEWYQREQELVGRIDDVKEANLKVIQMERLKMEETERRVTELEDLKHTLETDNKRLGLELDEVQREKESTKVEMAILEAKFESSQRKLEADLHAQMEREISEQVGEIHQKMEEMQEELQEKHRQHVTEIHARHQKDTERQIQQFHDDARRTEDNYRQKIQDLEERLTEYRNENSALKHSKQKLESQRMEILTKMQYMMQSQWNEAVSLLVSSPHKRQTVNGSFMSSFVQPAPPSTNLNLSIVSSGQPKTSSPNSNDNIRREAVSDVGQDRVTTVQGTDRVEEYINSLPTSNQNSMHQEREGGYLVSNDFAVNNHSFSSENSGNQLQDQPKTEPSNLIYSNDGGQGLTFPQLNLDQSLLSHLNGAGIPKNIHGYLVNQGSSLPANQSMHLQALANQNQAFFNLVTQPGAAVMLRPPQQQTHLYGQGQSEDHYLQCQGPYFQGQTVGQGSLPPSPSKHRSQRRVQRREEQRNTRYEDSDEDLLPPHPVYTNPGMSPPVKQSRQTQEEEVFYPGQSERHAASLDQLTGSMEETVRLNTDYSQISERVAEHETRQNELQHYVKMLLDRPPGTVDEKPEHDIPLTSDLETSREMTGEIDLNDTAQAAQLNRELQRLQQLREQVRQRDAMLGLKVQPERETARRQTEQKQAPAGVLDPGQLQEISRLLDQYRQQAETSQQVDDESVNQLLCLLQHLPPGSAPQPVTEQQRRTEGGVKLSPRSQRNKNRSHVTISQKKAPPVTMRPTSGGQTKHLLDTSVKSDSSHSGKNQPQKKVERKLAGNHGNKQQQSKTKMSAWK